MGGLVKSDICYVKIALFGVKIVLFHSHIYHAPSSPVCVCANEQPLPNPIFGRDIKDTAGRRAVAAHGELVAGLSTRNSGSLHKARRARREPPMRLHSPFLGAERLAIPCGETRAARDCVTETSSYMIIWSISNSTVVERAHFLSSNLQGVFLTGTPPKSSKYKKS